MGMRGDFFFVRDIFLDNIHNHVQIAGQLRREEVEANTDIRFLTLVLTLCGAPAARGADFHANDQSIRFEASIWSITGLNSLGHLILIHK